jgi:hypothetical protein
LVGIERESGAHLQAFLVVARLLEEDAQHGHELGLARVHVEAAAGDHHAPLVVTLGDAVEADDAHDQPVERVPLARALQQVLGLRALSLLERVDHGHVGALALVVDPVGQGHHVPVGR